MPVWSDRTTSCASFQRFGPFKTVKITAPLTNVSWGNPHGAAKVSYQGKVWDVILAPVARMEARGLTAAMVGPGREVTIEG